MAAVPYNITELLKDGLVMGLVGQKLAEAIDANFAAVTGGGPSGVVQINEGGTGATTALGARTNFGLGDLATLNSINNTLWSGAPLTVSNFDSTGLATQMGLGSLSLLNSINNSNWSGTALAIANGGTGATSAGAAKINLGLATVASTGAYGDLTGAPTLGSLAALSSINNTNWSGSVLTVPNGGTGLGTLTAHGVLIGNATGNVAVTAAGTAGQILTSNGSGADPTWQNAASAGGTVPTGGTGLTSVAAHALLIGNGTGNLTVLGPGTVNYVLTSNGAGADPSWQVSPGSGGTVPTGGTGLSTVAAHALLIGNGTSPLVVLGPGTSGYVLTAAGASADPAWGPAPSKPAAIYISDYVVGDNITDDHVAINTAVAAWKAAAINYGGLYYPGDLIFDRTCYIGSSTITIEGLAGQWSNGGRIKFINSVFLRGSSAQLGLVIKAYSSGAAQAWRGLELHDVFLFNCAIKLDQTLSGANLFQFRDFGTKIYWGGTTPTVHAYTILGVFEGVWYSPTIYWNDTNATHCIHMDNGPIGGVDGWSSNTFYSPNLHSGRRGFNAIGYNTDFRIYSPDIFLCKEWGIYGEAANAFIDGGHIESCCTGGGGFNAGIFLQVGGVVNNVVGVAFQSFGSTQKYVVRVAGPNSFTINGCETQGDVVGAKIAYIDGIANAGTPYLLTGTAAYSYDFSPFLGVGRLIAENTQLTTANNSNTTLVVPPGMMIESLPFLERGAHAVTGGVKIGTTSGGTDVVAACPVAASLPGVVPMAQLLKQFFSMTVATTLYIQPVTSWNGAIVDFAAKFRHV